MFRQLFLAAILVCLMANIALAQDAQRIAPKLPPANPSATLQPPAPTSRPTGDELIASPLQGLVFVDAPEKVHGTSSAHGIDTTQAPLLNSPRFSASVSGYLHKPLTMAQLNEICQLVVIYCHSIDRPIVDAIVPQQDVTSGSIQILVIEGRLGQVQAEGNRFFPSRILTRAVQARPGDPISQSELLDDVDWLNRNPFRRTDLVLQRGSEFGQTDVVLDTEDHFPLRVYTGYENTGTVSTGENRWLGGFNWGNAFGQDDQLNYQYTMNSNIERFQAHSASYVAPLPWRNVLTLFGNWSSSAVQTDPNVLQNGESWQISARYEIPLPRFYAISNSLVFGGDFKRSNTNADFGGSSVYASNVNVVQFMLGYDASRADSFGSTDATFEGYFSPSHLGAENSNSVYQNARTGADAQYAYVHLAADRTTNLPAQFSWASRFQGQIASSPLLGSEQVGVGGLDSVRGYEEREGNGDDAVIFSNELRTPPVSFLNLKNRKDQLTFLAFLDYGVAWTRDAQPGQFARENFLGAGPGVSYRLGPWLSIDYAYGWRLANGDPLVHASGRNHLRILASFTY